MSDLSTLELPARCPAGSRMHGSSQKTDLGVETERSIGAIISKEMAHGKGSFTKSL